MLNEPNFCKTKNEQITHFNNEQRTMHALPSLSRVEGSNVEGNNELFSNEPNFKITKIDVSPVIADKYMKNDVFALIKNEPNLRNNEQ